MPPINASVTNQQITASVGETQIDVNVSGGVGPTGTAGAAATVSVGTVTTGAPGSSAAVVNVGSSSAAVLNFTIPAGATGAQGIQGVAGPAGAAGQAATVSVGTVTTGAAGSSASVTNVGSSSAAVLNFTIPAGATGATGATGAKGDKGDRGDTGSSGVVAATSPLTYDAATQTVGIALPLSSSDVSGVAYATQFAGIADRAMGLWDNPAGEVGLAVNDSQLIVGATQDLSQWRAALGLGTAATVNLPLSSSDIAYTPDGPNIGATNVQDAISQLDNLSEVYVTATQYGSLYATPTTAGTVKIGSGVSIDANGVISVSTAYAATSHTHGNLTNDGKIGTTSGQIVVTTTGGALTTAASISSSQVSGLPTAGTGASNYCAGNDSRLSDARTPLSHTHSVGQIDGFSAAAAAAAPVQSVNGQTGAVTIATYSLPDATTSTKGGVIVGTGLGVSSGTVSVTYGTTSGTACQGNDSRLSDARTPTDGSVTTAKLANAAVTVAKVSATGSPDATTFLRGDGSWAPPSASVTYATALQARDATSTSVAMNPARTLDEIYNVWSTNMRSATTSQSGQALWQTAFAGVAQVQVGSSSGVGSIFGYYTGPAAWSPGLTKWNGSSGNYAGRYIDWTKRQKFRIRLVPFTGPTSGATYRVTLGKTTTGTAGIGALSVRGVGFEIRGAGALWLTTHNGTGITNTNSNQTLSTSVAYEIICESDGSGNATLYLDGTSVATSTGAPTTVQTDFASAVFAIEATTADSSTSMIIFEQDPQIFRP